MQKIFTVVLISLTSTTLLAQQDSIKINKLEEAVVTGQFTPQSAKNSVYQVHVITADRIRKLGSAKLQDVLGNELNIRFTQDLATGGSDITMLGLKGQNVKILIDGLPMTGRQGTSNEININQVDVNTIERIEIVEGPMSVVYGADALAGVINIITKKAAKAKLSVTARVHEETVGKEYNFSGKGMHNQYAGLSYRYKNWEIGGGFGHNYFGGWKDTATGRELVWHKKDQLTGNGFIAYHKNNFSIRYRFDGLDEVITNPGNFLFYNRDSDDTLAEDAEYLTQRLMQQLQASYAPNSHLSFQMQSAYTHYSRQVFSTTVSEKTGDVRLNTATGAQSMIDFNGFTFRGTAFYRWSNKVSFQPGVDINTENGEGERLKEGKNKVSDYAFFISSEITPTEKINIRPGIRIVKNSVYNAPPVIPSINAKYAITKDLALRLAYARGFRAPSLRELYFNFFDANHQIIGNPGLKAETSNSFTGSLTWKKLHNGLNHSVALGGFYNEVKNMIDYAVSSNPNVFILTNVSNSKTAGVNLTASAKNTAWDLNIGASYTGFYNDYSGTDKSLPDLQWSAEANAGIGYTFEKIGMSANLFYKLTGKRPVYVQSGQTFILSQQKGYHWADLTLNKRVCKSISASAGIHNLFDVETVGSSVVAGGIHTSNGNRFIGTGRSYFLGLNVNLNNQ